MSPSSTSGHADATPRRRRIEASGTELEIYEWGQASGPAILLAHGIQDFALTLAPVAEAFAAHHRVVAYDLRGHGESAHPGIYTMAHHIADLHALFLDCELERPIVIGHSLGDQVVAQLGVPRRAPPGLPSFGLPPCVGAAVLAIHAQFDTRNGLWKLPEAQVTGGPPQQEVPPNEARTLVPWPAAERAVLRWVGAANRAAVGSGS